jgi:hypothetical protein
VTIAPTYVELEGMTLEELKRRHDEIATNTQVGLAWYGDEINRRENERQTRTLIRLTQAIVSLYVL